MIPHIALLSKSVSNFFWDSDTLICTASLDFFNVKLARLDASNVTALARLLNTSNMCASYI